MAGPPASVKIAAPIPTDMFGPVPNLGPAFDRLTTIPTVFQHHNGSPNVLPPFPGRIGAPARVPGIRTGGQWWMPVWQYWRDRFRTLQAIPGPGAVPGG